MINYKIYIYLNFILKLANHFHITKANVPKFGSLQAIPSLLKPKPLQKLVEKIWPKIKNAQLLLEGQLLKKNECN